MGLVSGIVLLTGASGFLGTQMARRLLADTDVSLVALVRGETDDAAARRLRRAWWDWPELGDAIGRRVDVVRGDVAETRLGLTSDVYGELARRLTHVMHSAADVRLRASPDEQAKTNVGGTKEVLDLALAAHADHGLARFCHVSTAYVAGRDRGLVYEADCGGATATAPHYERTKCEAERLVREQSEALSITILRPGMVVGDSQTGEIKTFNTVYAPLRLYLTGRLRVVPGSSATRANLVPVDYVADAAARLAVDERAKGMTFHLTAPWDTLPTYRELTEAVRSWAARRLGVRLTRPLFLPLPWRRGAGGAGALGLLSTLAPYLDDRRRFDRKNTDELLGPYALDWREYMPRLLDYATYHGFLHRSERTVHEQVLFRLGSRSRRTTYHDIGEAGPRARSAGEVRDEALRAAAALEAMGIRKGDRVAWVATNSTRVLSLDVAIGLLGAVSVPLYYTSPPGEVDAILADSGTRLLFVGARSLLERVDEIETTVPIVSLCRGGVPASIRRDVIEWDSFLARGSGRPRVRQAPVDFGDIATVRYTSGTTGKPKGIPFHHGNLRYMAESIVSLVPWRARTRQITMLSFLPMNHVVEGILTTYAPYYAPAPLDLWFLEDFRSLARALPRVRPTFFFSVPRFYERVWSQILESPALRGVACSGGGRLVEPVRRAVGRLVLRRAGLDRCAQLLVGSAPARADVLEGLSRLGVDVHNAYGLTEAPLVTLTRVGTRRPGTVGEPLPKTEIRIAPDGEILVRGPQVTPEALHGGCDLGVHDGWLSTGDLGSVDAAGHLVISGRKKELIVTAYGKNVAPAKVEERLRCVPRVREAMLVGEGEPYCAALLWTGAATIDDRLAREIDDAVEAANEGLSHPERAKAWIVFPYDLSIEKGELTANLKLRRGVVMERRADAIRALYGRGPLPAVACHIGRAERET